MRTVTLFAPAKVNLTLDIVSKRDDGYHIIDGIFQSITLFDEVSIRLCDEIKVTTSNENIADDNTNLAYRAAVAFASATGCDTGALISIKKRIPTEAGLGGGSSDAAAVLVGLNELTNARLSQEDLCKIGEKIGADVPFCIVGGTKRASGIGTEFTDVKKLDDGLFVIVKPPFGVSSTEAYKRWDALEFATKCTTNEMTLALESENLSSIAECMSNSFETVVDESEKIKNIKNLLLNCGAHGSCMTGSGSAVIGLFDTEISREYIKKELCDIGEIFFAVPTYQGAVIAWEKIL